jgi:uncharacterized protein YfeS
MKLKLILPVICLIVLCGHPGFSQSENSKAVKFDEFGDIDISYLKARLDNFAIELQNRPDVRGFIMVFRSRRDLPGLNSRLANRMRNYMTYTRGISAERVVTIDGGEAGCLSQELWIVPPGTAPTAREDAYSRNLVDVESTRKFDEYHYSKEGDSSMDESGSVDGGDSLEAFAEALRKEPRAKAYIIVYPQYYIERSEETLSNNGVEGKTIKHKRLHQDSRGVVLQVMREITSDLVHKHHIAAHQIKVVNGGYRKLRFVELWIVPRGEHAPISTPNAFPKKK